MHSMLLEIWVWRSQNWSKSSEVFGSNFVSCRPVDANIFNRKVRGTVRCEHRFEIFVIALNHERRNFVWCGVIVNLTFDITAGNLGFYSQILLALALPCNIYFWWKANNEIRRINKFPDIFFHCEVRGNLQMHFQLGTWMSKIRVMQVQVWTSSAWKAIGQTAAVITSSQTQHYFTTHPIQICLN